MDKRFQKVIENMDDLISRYEKLYKEINEQFSKVKDTQNEINGEIDLINSKIAETINDFESESKHMFSDTNKMIDEKKILMDGTIENIQNALIAVQEEYKAKVEILVQSIDEKSNEILEIHSELENIRKIQQDAVSKFSELSNHQNQAIESFKKKQQALLDKSALGEIKLLLESFETRIKKLEKHAHKHTFGGIKV